MPRSTASERASLRSIRRRREARAGRAALVAVGLVAASAEVGSAQTASDRQRLERQLSDTAGRFQQGPNPGGPASESTYFDVGLSFREAFINATNSDGTSSQLWQTRGRLSADLSFAGAHEFYARLNLDNRQYADGDQPSGNQNQFDQGYLDRIWYRFDLNNHQRLVGETPGAWDVTFTGGRQPIEWASGLTFSNDLYAGLVEVDMAGVARLSLVGGVTPRDNVDFDGSRPGFDTHTRRWIYGANLALTANPAFRPYVFFLGQIDANTEDFTEFDIGGVGVPTHFKYDSSYGGIGAQGAIGEHLVWAAEGVYEWGRSLSNPFDYITFDVLPQTEDNISAWAAIGSLTYLFNDRNDSEVYLYVLSGSGDSDRQSSNQTLGGNARYSTDQAFNAFGYVPTGFALAPDIANLVITRLGGSTRFGSSPASNLRLGVDGYTYTRLEDQGGNSFATDRGGRFVGTAADVFARWQISSDVSMDVRYGVFFPGSAIPDASNDIRHFVYAGVNYVF